MREWRPLAEQGDSYAQHNLGVLYANGQGVPQDYAQARQWYEKAAAQGLAEAQSNLGVLYANGQGVLQDFVQAHMWYNLAAANGDTFGGELRDALALQMTPCPDRRGTEAGMGVEAERQMSNDRPTRESMSIEEATVSKK